MVLKIKIFTVLILLFLSSGVFAQFQLNGTAIVKNDDCFRLTPAEDGSSGSVWMTNKLNLNESFELTAQIFLGCSDKGADGIVFGLQAISTSVGVGGFGMGFGGIRPSIGIEFDTHKNGDQEDPSFDHMAIIRNGNVDHTSSDNLAGPIQIHPVDSNVEDCEEHELHIVWDALTMQLEVSFDCEARLSYTGDIVNDIFNGDPNVFWGFTAGTGAANNEQVVCLEKIEFIEPLEDIILCPGGQIQLQAKGGDTYQWTPSNGLDNPTIANPIASPIATTTYFLKITDGCSFSFLDTLTIYVDGDSIFFELKDTSLCNGENLLLDATSSNATYLWSTGDTVSNINPEKTGLYEVTVTKDEYCIATDQSFVDFIKLPPINFSPINTICPNETIELDVSFRDATYLWQDDSTSPIYQVSETGEYRVTLTHFCGTRILKADIALEPSCVDVYIPNAFSPNADGVNDRLIIQDGGDVVEILSFRIYNRWGAVVHEDKKFQTNDRLHAWNGKYKGQTVNKGVYLYVAEILFRNGETILLSGDIMVF